MEGKKRGKVRLVGPLEAIPLPDLSEVKEKMEGLVEGVTNLKDLPKSLIERLTEADQDFKEADKIFRRSRISGKRG